MPSTQDAALEAARNGAPGRLAIIAAQQTAGRGRNANPWHAPAGNLNFSALLRPDHPAPPGYWPLLAGLALHDAIAAALPNPNGLMLKWPNDLLLNGAKLAGILIDSAIGSHGIPDWVVIGIGVNIAAAPEIAGRRITCLADHGATVTPTGLAATLAKKLDHWMAADFPTIRAAWLACAHPTGTPLAINGAPAGAFAGLSPEGALLLAGHTTPIHVGDIQLAIPCFS
jgi:BirA family biotin operon repressor/biotin-[acetyl-CoA-carboxylase] ligase